VYSFRSCPVVLEFQASHALLRNYKRQSPHLFVLPGTPGVCLPGLRLNAVFWNHRFCVNYKRLHDPDVRSAIIRAGGVQNACCGLGRQFLDFQCCGAWTPDAMQDFVKLGKFRVCRDCHSRWT